jgi:hypothetical protein
MARLDETPHRFLSHTLADLGLFWPQCYVSAFGFEGPETQVGNFLPQAGDRGVSPTVQILSQLPWPCRSQCPEGGGETPELWPGIQGQGDQCLRKDITTAGLLSLTRVAEALVLGGQQSLSGPARGLARPGCEDWAGGGGFCRTYVFKFAKPRSQVCFFFFPSKFQLRSESLLGRCVYFTGDKVHIL